MSTVYSAAVICLVLRGGLRDDNYSVRMQMLLTPLVFKAPDVKEINEMLYNVT